MTFDVMHQRDDFLGKSPGVRGGLPICPRMLQHGQEVQTLATDVDQIQGELPVWGVTQRAAEEREEEWNRPKVKSVLLI